MMKWILVATLLILGMPVLCLALEEAAPPAAPDGKILWQFDTGG